MDRQDENRKLLALCALPKFDGKRIDWCLLAREATRPDGIERLFQGEVAEESAAATEAREVLPYVLPRIKKAFGQVESHLAAAEEVGARLVTVLDDDYPSNLRLIPNLPPFLFIKGTGFIDADLKSVCVVGTRQDSAKGLLLAGDMAKRLVGEGVTVVSGLASGIDTAAHRAALTAGGRTLAVVGTGICHTYPPENEDLAAEICKGGAIISSFWPTAPPTRWSFPARNVVMSGIAQGTVVIEANSTSGAKMQARLALEHGKEAFLVRSLVERQKWARDSMEKRGAVAVDGVDEVISRLAAPERVQIKAEQRRLLAQLSLELV